MKIRTLIVDDMQLARKRVRRYLLPDPDIEIVGECPDGRGAVAMISEIRPDLVFLDVQMPGMSGFEVLQELAEENLPVVIFVTAYDEFALKAFEVNALDYLLKPFDRDRFYKALSRAKSLINQRRNGPPGNKELRDFITSIQKDPAASARVALKSNGRVVFVATEDIDWVESAGNYITVQAGKEAHLVRETLGRFEEKLNAEKFARINRSVIVNLDRIKEMHPLFSGDQELILIGGKRFTLSRNYREKISSILGL